MLFKNNKTKQNKLSENTKSRIQTRGKRNRNENNIMLVMMRMIMSAIETALK